MTPCNNCGKLHVPDGYTSKTKQRCLDILSGKIKKYRPAPYDGTLRGYNRIHKWCERKFKKTGRCVKCRNNCNTQWSNISLKYLHARDDWQELCAKCHHEFDVRVHEKGVKPPVFIR